MKKFHFRAALLAGSVASSLAVGSARAQNVLSSPALDKLSVLLRDKDNDEFRGELARDVARVIGSSHRFQQKGANPANLIGALVANSLAPILAGNTEATYREFEVWRTLALDATAVDHIGHFDRDSDTSVSDQYGPPRTSRALALVQLAIFEVANSFAPPAWHAKSWLLMQHDRVLPALPPHAVEAAAIAGAANLALRTLYDGQKEIFDDALQASVQRIAQSSPGISPQAIQISIAYGQQIASEVMRQRKRDHLKSRDSQWGAYQPRGGFDNNGDADPGVWSMDPVSKSTLVLGLTWGRVKPFTGLDANAPQFTIPVLPHDFLASPIFSAALEQVMTYGGDERHNIPRKDSAGKDRYYRAKFWAYDASAGLCAPVRLYGQIAAKVLLKYADTLAPDLTAARMGQAGAHGDAAVAQAARYFALVNLTLADAAIVGWKAKYDHSFWRPVTGIRWMQAHPASMPAELRPLYKTAWFPLGAQSTNSDTGYNITPPFPSYPSGHAVFGGALFQLLRRLVPNDHGFSFRSDEFNGPESFSINIDAYNFERCKAVDTNAKYCGEIPFASFTEAETDNALSRVWMGVHWSFDASCGMELGEQVGDWAFAHAVTLDHPAGDQGMPSRPVENDCYKRVLSDAYLPPVVK
jgi:membrane-associated phospholipid phosphatase